MNINEPESAEFRAGRNAALAEAARKRQASVEAMAANLQHLRRGFLRRAAIAVGVAVVGGLAAGYLIAQL